MMPAAPARAATSDAAQLARLRDFLRWILPIILGFCVVTAVAAALLGDIAVAAIAAVCLTYSTALVVAVRLARSERLRPAVAVTSVCLLVCDLAAILVMPALLSTLALIPVLWWPSPCSDAAPAAPGDLSLLITDDIEIH